MLHPSQTEPVVSVFVRVGRLSLNISNRADFLSSSHFDSPVRIIAFCERWDWFILNTARATADACIITGQELRDEPHISNNIQDDSVPNSTNQVHMRRLLSGGTILLDGLRGVLEAQPDSRTQPAPSDNLNESTANQSKGNVNSAQKC